jgi:hypothetical protein
LLDKVYLQYNGCPRLAYFEDGVLPSSDVLEFKFPINLWVGLKPSKYFSASEVEGATIEHSGLHE